MSSFFIRDALPDDAASLWALQQAAYSPLASFLPSRPTALDENEAFLRHRLELVPCQVVVRVGGELVAAGRIEGVAPLGELKRIAVHPDRQSLGLGRKLVLALEDKARQLGFVRLRAGTRRRLPGNVAFYERLGYRIVAVEPYPAGIDDETVWLEKRLLARQEQGTSE